MPHFCKAIKVDVLSVALCRHNPDILYVFGDNLIGRGRVGQAIIRNEPNAVGIPTKRLPSMYIDSFFSDKDEEIEMVLRAVRAVYDRGILENKVVAFPSAGIGTGLARMQEKSPILFEEMNNLIRALFNITFEELWS